MMITRMTLGLAGLMTCWTLGACTPETKSTEVALTPASMQGIESLYHAATARPQYRRSVRKPVRDARARALRKLAAETEAMIAETQSWDSAAALTGDTGTRVAEVGEFQDALRTLKAAADAADTAQLRSAYARLLATHQRLPETLR